MVGDHMFALIINYGSISLLGSIAGYVAKFAGGGGTIEILQVKYLNNIVEQGNPKSCDTTLSLPSQSAALVSLGIATPLEALKASYTLQGK